MTTNAETLTTPKFRPSSLAAPCAAAPSAPLEAQRRGFPALVLGAIVLPLALTAPAWALDPGDLDTSFSGDGIVVAPAVVAGPAQSAEGRAVVLSEGASLSAILGQTPASYRVGFEVDRDGSPFGYFDGSSDPDDDGLAANASSFCPTQYSDAVREPCSDFLCFDSLFVAGNDPNFGDVGCDGRPVFTVFEVSSFTGLEDGFYHTLIEGSEAESFGIARRSADGDLIAVGARYSTPARVALVRLNSNLTVDTSFGGGDGIITHAIGSGSAAAYEVALQSNGKIVAVGAAGSITSANGWPHTGTSAFVARFTEAGALDSSFGTGGIVSWTPAGTDAAVASGVQVASDGDIVVSGKYHVPLSCEGLFCTGGWYGFVRRYTSTGALETGFGGGDGEVTDYSAQFEDVVLDSEGRITAVGSWGGGGLIARDVGALLVRYTADGTLDSSFGSNGTATFEESSGFTRIRIMSAEMSADSSEITVGGTMYAPSGDTDRMFLARVVGGPICGNGTVDSGEDCDLGDGVNGASGNCCTSECLYAAALTECRAGFGAPNGGDVCDPAETCTGASDTCPTDVHHDFVVCRTGNGDFCDPHETCPVGAGAVCGANIIQSAGTVCSLADSGDSCDPAEECDGIATHGCPTDVVEPAGTTCRAGSGDMCDPAETCTGVAAAPCPADVVTAASTECRAAADATCDVAENCTGTAGQACPADVHAAAETICRAAVDICDLTETCGGAVATCPADLQKPDADADTLCDEIDNCVSIANADQADGDSDEVGNVCDNCPDTCNPDQDNSDSDAGGGDVCDVCPAVDQSAELAACATAAYNSALACCRASASEGISVDATGASCGGAGDVSFQTPPDPDTGTTVTVEIPVGAVSGPTSISVTPMTKGGSDYILSTATGRFVTGAIMEPAGTTFNNPLLICMAWQDADNNDRVDNLEYVVEEANIRPTLHDDMTNTEVVLGPRCGLQAACGALGGDGLPATVPGTLDDPTLAACCSATDNVYCFEVTHFSAYAIADLSCTGEATGRVIATRMDKAAGGQGLKVKGAFDLGAPITGGLDPATSGFELVILSAGGAPLYQVTLPAGAYSSATGEGWKTSARGGRAQWKSKTGISGVDKVKLEWDDTTGQGSFDLKGKNLSLVVDPADLPLQAEVRLDPADLAGHCGLATWAAPDGMCAFNSTGTTLLCQ